jgi:outer membrane lipoprotein-sorting protein
MKSGIRLMVLLIMLLILSSQLVFAITAEEIINKRDDNEFYESARVEAEMIIINGSREMSKELISISDKNNALSEFINPRDRGTKFLKRGDDLWMFFPDAEELVKISGHMLEQGVMGSDFSYQDMMESDKLTELYDYRIIGEEMVDNRLSYVLEGIAIEGKEVSYYRRLTWVDKERFIGLKEELYAKSGRLLKIITVEKIEEINERWFPMSTVMENKLRKDTRTIFNILSIEFNPEIPENTFSLENLR